MGNETKHTPECEQDRIDGPYNCALRQQRDELAAALRLAEQRIAALSPPGYVAPELWAIRAALGKIA